MNRLSLFADRSGRVSLDTRGSPRVTSAAVLFPTADVPSIRADLPSSLPKWRASSLSDNEQIVGLLISRAVSVGVMSINKDTEAWRRFAEDAKILQREILLQSKSPAGWVKPTNLLAFSLLGFAVAIATGHGLRVGPKTRILGADGLQVIERSIVFDSDISGEENIEVFKSFWNKRHIPRSRLADLGIRMAYDDVCISTEQEEPMLLVADYAAGIAHAALLPKASHNHFPLSHEEAENFLSHLNNAGKLAVENRNFDYSYDDIFGSVMKFARKQAACENKESDS